MRQPCKHVFAFARSDTEKILKTGLKCHKCKTVIEVTPELLDYLLQKPPPARIVQW